MTTSAVQIRYNASFPAGDIEELRQGLADRFGSAQAVQSEAEPQAFLEIIGPALVEITLAGLMAAFVTEITRELGKKTLALVIQTFKKAKDLGFKWKSGSDAKAKAAGKPAIPLRIEGVLVNNVVLKLVFPDNLDEKSLKDALMKSAAVVDRANQIAAKVPEAKQQKLNAILNETIADYEENLDPDLQFFDTFQALVFVYRKDRAEWVNAAEDLKRLTG